MNYRLHEKYVIIDNNIYILGGRNTHDVYLRKGKNEQCDRDILVYIPVENNHSSLIDLKKYFESNWKQKECVKIKVKKRKASVNQPLCSIRTKDFVVTSKELMEKTIEADGITLLRNSFVAWNKSPILWKQLCNFIKKAKRNVIIQTPLIVIDKKMCHDLSKISNGFTIELLTNSDINWINPLAAVYTKIKSRILAANVEIYEYQSNIQYIQKPLQLMSNIQLLVHIILIIAVLILILN